MENANQVPGLTPERVQAINDVVADGMKAKAEAIRAKAVRLIQIKALMDANKPLYEELDRLTMELKEGLGLGTLPVVLTEKEAMYMHNDDVKFIAQNQVLTIVNNFSEKNTVFRPAGVRQFEAAVETAEEHSIRMEKIAKKKAKDAKSE